MNDKFTIDEVIAWHRAGQLDQAKQGYLALLEMNPQDVTALHMLGLLTAEEGYLESALELIKQAHVLAPNDQFIALHFANLLKAQGLYSEATKVLVEVIQAFPAFASAYNNLGSIYYAQKNWQAAIEAFQQTIDLQPNHSDAYYNLGLSLSKTKQFEQAINVYQALLELVPQHVFGQFQLASLYMKTNQFPAAIKHFLMVEQAHQYHLETQINLANCYLNMGDLEQAKKYYLRALEIDATDKQLFFNLGVINSQQGKSQDAIENYLKALRIDENYCDAHNNLAVAYLAAKKIPQALQHFKEVLRIQPNNEAVRHLISVLSQDKQITSSPQTYIQSLFDNYASHYDQHLQTLHYRVPDLFYKLFSEINKNHFQSLDILDLGCGTGLCGEMFKQQAHLLIGVDLSTQMLAMAAQKNIYDQLIEADILSFMQATSATFDLILVGDVLVYFGDLTEVFIAMKHIIRPGGLIILNTEMTEQTDYELLQSGRFGHHQDYLDRLAKNLQFTILKKRIVNLRTQNHSEVAGYLYCLQAPSA